MVESETQGEKKRRDSSPPISSHCDFPVPAEGVGVCRDESGGGGVG